MRCNDYIQCPVEFHRYRNGLYKITSRTTGNEPYHGLGSDGPILSHKPIHYLIQGSISSYTDNQLSTFMKGIMSKYGSISWTGCEKGLKRP